MQECGPRVATTPVFPEKPEIQIFQANVLGVFKYRKPVEKPNTKTHLSTFSDPMKPACGLHVPMSQPCATSNLMTTHEQQFMTRWCPPTCLLSHDFLWPEAQTLPCSMGSGRDTLPFKAGHEHPCGKVGGDAGTGFTLEIRGPRLTSCTALNSLLGTQLPLQQKRVSERTK